MEGENRSGLGQMEQVNGRKKNSENKDVWLRIGNVLLQLLMWGPVFCLILFWQRIPDQIPTHYGGSEIADHWGSKSSLLIMPVFAFLIFYLMNFLAGYLIRCASAENFYGEKAKGKTTRQDVAYGKLQTLKMQVYMIDWCLLLFAYIMTASALCRDHLSSVVIYGILTALAVQFCYYMGKLWKRRKQILASKSASDG